MTVEERIEKIKSELKILRNSSRTIYTYNKQLKLQKELEDLQNEQTKGTGSEV